MAHRNVKTADPGEVVRSGHADSVFMWGTTSASVQAEGVHAAADWSRWERDHVAPRSNDGNGFATNFHDDFAALAEIGSNAVRITIEWARIEPEEGKVDSEALDRYADMVSAARAAGLDPWATLHHTSLPGWFSEDRRGFADERSREYLWPRHVDRCAERFGDDVAGWVPIEDPVGWAIRSHALGNRPPGHRNNTDLGMLAFYEQAEGALQADHLAARLLATGGARVMAVRGAPTIFTVVEDPQSDLEANAAGQKVRWWAHLLFDSWIAMLSDGELALPDRHRVQQEEWVNDFDLIGLAFDHPIGVDHRGALHPYPASGHRSDTGFSPEPEELGVQLHRIAERLDTRPFVVAANGLATTDDGWRSEVLEATLDVVDQVVADGIDLVGYFHDTGIDGYEWRAGYSTERGLISRARTIKDSGHLFRDRVARSIATAADLDDAAVDLDE